MREITPQLTEDLRRHFGDAVARRDAYPIATYNALVRKIAELSYLNRDNLLFFRGQSRDFRNKAGASTLYPSLYRRNVLSKGKLEYEFDLLEELSALLIEETRKVDRKSADEIRRRQYIQWSLIQHYGVHETPLLDLTQSLRVACSFAQSGSGTTEGFVYVLGLPYLPNGISINSEQEIVNIRLLSTCPALAMRPYFQEGFLVGTPDLTDNYDDKNELDFNRRLVAKFKIPCAPGFWEGNPGRVPEELLFPGEDEDPMLKICTALREAVMKMDGLLFGSGSPDGSNDLAALLRRRLG